MRRWDYERNMWQGVLKFEYFNRWGEEKKNLPSVDVFPGGHLKWTNLILPNNLKQPWGSAPPYTQTFLMLAPCIASVQPALYNSHGERYNVPYHTGLASHRDYT